MDSAIVPRDHLRACLLLLVAETPVHGYDVHGLLEPLGLGTADRAAVYRTLRQLEAEGLVVSSWDGSPVGPARRTYRVTAAGEAWAGAASAGLRQVDRHMARWLSRYRALRLAGGPEAVRGVPAAS